MQPPAPIPKADPARFTIRVSAAEAERIERMRDRLRIDAFPLSENRVLAILIARGLDSLEAELGDAPSKAA